MKINYLLIFSKYKVFYEYTLNKCIMFLMRKFTVIDFHGKRINNFLSNNAATIQRQRIFDFIANVYNFLIISCKLFKKYMFFRTVKQTLLLPI